MYSAALLHKRLNNPPRVKCGAGHQATVFHLAHTAPLSTALIFLPDRKGFDEGAIRPINKC